MGKWYSENSRGAGKAHAEFSELLTKMLSVFGFWGSNGNVGNILGGLVASWILAWNVSWDYVFYFTAALNVCGGNFDSFGVFFN